MRGAVAIPTGPGDHEIERLHDLVASIDAWTAGETVVVIDDAPEPRPIEAMFPDAQVLRPPRRGQGHPHDHMTAGSITALRWFAAGDADYMVKLDTDALVIGDYRPSLHAAIRGRPDVGMWGAYTQNEVGGAERDLTHFRLMLRHAMLPVRPRRGGRAGIQLEQALVGQTGRARRFLGRTIRRGRRHGYRLGEHCLGGAYAVTAPAAGAMREAGLLDDPLATATLRISEDIVVGLLTRAAGYELGSLVAPGEPFAVKHQGLLAAPAALQERGHAIIHSLKDDERQSEAAIRSWFAAQRR